MSGGEKERSERERKKERKSERVESIRKTVRRCVSGIKILAIILTLLVS